MNGHLIDPSVRKQPEAGLPGKSVKLRIDLQKAVIDCFLPRFGNGAKLVYAGLKGGGRRYIDTELSERLGLTIDSSSTLAAVIAHSESKNWLYVIDSPINRGGSCQKRETTLTQIARNSRCHLVFVSVFGSRTSFTKYMSRIGRDVVVWLAAEPDHTIYWGRGDLLEPRMYSNRR